VIKDRQYTTQENSRARRSAQTALNHILEAMVKWLSPVLSYTAEEVWQSMPSEKTNSIFLAEWYTNLASGYDNVAIDAARNINPFIRKQMEGMRSDKVIGSSLDAEVDLYCDENNYNALSQLDDELRFVFITSYARIHPLSDKTDNCIEAGEGVFIEVTKSNLSLLNKRSLRYKLADAEKDYLLAVVSKIIYDSPLRDKLVFKGGTAIHHCYMSQSFHFQLWHVHFAVFVLE